MAIKMDVAERAKMQEIETAIRALIYGEHQELYEEAKERGMFVLESILGVFPSGVFKQLPELETVYQKLQGDNPAEEAST